MIWTGKNEGKSKVLVDSKGNLVPFVKSFNDETKEAEIYLCNSKGHIIHSGSEPMVVLVKLDGAKLRDKLDG